MSHARHRSGEGAREARTRREVVRRAFGLDDPDRRQLTRLWELEQLAAEVYGRATRSEHLSPAAHDLVGHIHAQERVHADALGRLLHPSGMRGSHLFPSGATTAVEAALARNGIGVAMHSLHDERGWLTLLEDLESALEGAHYKALRRLSASGPATLVARILASEAQHLTLLFRLRHPQDIRLAVFEALVEGTAARS